LERWLGRIHTAVLVLQLGELTVSPAPYMVKEALYVVAPLTGAAEGDAALVEVVVAVVVRSVVAGSVYTLVPNNIR